MTVPVPDVLILKDGTTVESGSLIHIECRSYRFVDHPDGVTSTCLVDGEDGVYKFIKNVPEQKGILVAEKEGTGTYFIYTGPDRISKYGSHVRAPIITLPRKRTIKPVKRKSKTEIVMAPSVVGSKQKDLAPLPKRRGRPPKNKDRGKETVRKAVKKLKKKKKAK